MRRLEQMMLGAILAVTLSACSSHSSGGGPGAPCQTPNDCASGACLEVSCTNGATRVVCGGSACSGSCIGDQTCVEVSGSSESYCVPAAVCTGGGGGTTDCDNACAYIYNTCNLALLDTGGAQLSQDECAQTCADLGRVNMEACARAADCDADATVACFQ